MRTRTERGETDSLFAGISAHVDSERVLDYGPLFNPLALLHEDTHAVQPEPEPASVALPTNAEEKENARRALQALVSLASTRFRIEHRKIHATLNQRFGGPIASATADSIERRHQAVLAWLERNRYDGLR